MSENKPPNSHEDNKSLKDLDARVRAALDKRQAEESRCDSDGQSGAGIAAKIGVEMVSALVIGVLIGVSLDKWLETKPWFLIVFLFLGAAAGFLNVYRTASGYGSAIGYKRPADKEPAEQDRDRKG